MSPHCNKESSRYEFNNHSGNMNQLDTEYVKKIVTMDFHTPYIVHYFFTDNMYVSKL